MVVIYTVKLRVLQRRKREKFWAYVQKIAWGAILVRIFFSFFSANLPPPQFWRPGHVPPFPPFSYATVQL